MNNKRRMWWIFTTVLVVLLALAACRPAAEDEDPSPTPAESSGVKSEDADDGAAADLPAPMNTPRPTQEAPPAGEGEFPLSVANQERMAELPTPPPNAVIPTPAGFQPEELRVRGSSNALVTIIEFSDYQCPYCQGYVNDAYPQIIEKLVETGYVRYIFKDFPLESIHPQAAKAAEAARCAGEQELYWEMHDALFASQNQWSGKDNPVSDFVELGKELGLDEGELEDCINSDRYQTAVAADVAEGLAAGVTGTPTFFINGYPLVGGRPYELFELASALAFNGRLPEAYAQVPTPTPMPASEIPTGDSATLGSSDAPVTIIEYSDFQCPYCSRYNSDTFSQIKANYIDTGKVKYVFKDFPLSFHAQANLAAQAARCAGDQEAFWEMHDLLFARQGEWSNDSAAVNFVQYAQDMGLDTESFGNCLGSGVYEQAVNDDLMEGLSVGVSGTPAFFIGDQFISGAQPYEVFVQAIEAALEGAQ